MLEASGFRSMSRNRLGLEASASYYLKHLSPQIVNIGHQKSYALAGPPRQAAHCWRAATLGTSRCSGAVPHMTSASCNPSKTNNRKPGQGSGWHQKPTAFCVQLHLRSPRLLRFSLGDRLPSHGGMAPSWAFAPGVPL